MVNLGEAYRKLIGKTVRAARADKQKTNKRRTKDEQKTVRATRADREKTNKRRCDSHEQMRKRRRKSDAKAKVS